MLDVLKFWATTEPSGAPPYQSVGGFQAIEANASGMLTLNLPEGEYTFYCAVPDSDPAKNGLRHVQEGMLKQVSIR